MNRYIRQIVSRLECSKERKEEIRKQLLSDYMEAAELGGGEQDIQAKMGTVKEIVEAFNSSFPEEERRKFRRQKRVRILIPVVIVAAVAVWLIVWSFPKTEPIGAGGYFTEGEVAEQTEYIIDLLDQKDYEALEACSTEEMKIVFEDSETLEAGMNQIAADFGSRQRIGNMYMTGIRQRGRLSATVQVNVAYENTSVTYTVSFDEDMKLQGLWMK